MFGHQLDLVVKKLPPPTVPIGPMHQSIHFGVVAVVRIEGLQPSCISSASQHPDAFHQMEHVVAVSLGVEQHTLFRTLVVRDDRAWGDDYVAVPAFLEYPTGTESPESFREGVVDVSCSDDVGNHFVNL